MTNERYVPYVIEPAAGVTAPRWPSCATPTTRSRIKGETRTVLRLHQSLAPYKVAVLPLSKKESLSDAWPARSSGRYAPTG